ncbi:MAG: hypothetical protein QM488_07730 [Rhizobiaceae bacterium]
MNALTSRKPPVFLFTAFFIVVFGGLTIYSGGAVLFGDGIAREAAGNYVPFVVWFNFLSGFVYIVAGIGLFLWREFAVNLSMFIFLATALVFAAFGLHILFDGSYEWRTVGAMALRSGVWLAIALYSRALWKKEAIL